MPNYKQLTNRQQKFVVNYIKNGFNATQAATHAGYSKYFVRHKSNQLLDVPGISERVIAAYKTQELRRFKEICMTVQERVEVLDRIIRAVVPKDKDQPIDMRHAKVALAAIAELNKMSGDYAPDRRLSVTVDATQDRLKDARKQYDEF